MHADIKRKQQKEKLRQKQQQQQLEPMSENKKLSKNRKAESTSGVSQKRRGLANLFSSKDYTASNNSSPKQNKKSMKSSTSYPHELVEQANQ